MKILYYNWVDYEDAQKRGGGVSIYQKNLIEASAAEGDAVFFLSAGMAYDLFSRRIYFQELKVSDGRSRKFEIVNSPIVSPGHAAFDQDVASSPSVERALVDFLHRHGPFDVVHLNNLEGLPLSFPAIVRGHATNVKLILSLHNYFAVCPQVNLWFQEKQNCVDFAAGRKCVNCIPAPLRPAGTKYKYTLETLLRRLGVARNPRLHRFAQALTLRLIKPMYLAAKRSSKLIRSTPEGEPIRILDPQRAEYFFQRRAAFVEAVNREVDHVLAVSERVGVLAVRYGVRADKVSTAYIGTRFARVAASTPPRREYTGDRPLSLAYLGYMRRDKGFYFLLKAFETLPKRLHGRFSLTLAVKITDVHAVEHLRRFAYKFAALTIVDGYTHATLPRILADVDLGVVPVLWEDNLPQVAIEMVGSGVPILTSDLGGAKELLNCPELTFQADSAKDFYSKLEIILANPGLLRKAMAGRATLLSMAEHYQILKERFYSVRPSAALAERRAA